MNNSNLLLIGFGSHARRIYFPVSERDGDTHNFKIVCAVDRKEKQEDIENYLQKRPNKPELLYIDETSVRNNSLSRDLKATLNSLVERHKVTGVIIATDPLVHKVYALWALEQGLSILMDKPITAVPHASISIGASKKILQDFIDINDYYKKQKSKQRIIFSLMAQRRYHSAYQKIREIIIEVHEKTNCPITSMQSFHSDGQWRLPTEIVDIDYHSYNYGFGKFLHTGYHSIDIAQWLLEATDKGSKRINNVDVYTRVVRPADFFTQITLDDYRKIFPDFDTYNKYSEDELLKLTKGFGEIDAFSTLAFKHNEKILTLGSLNLVHNGFSQRGWVSSAGRNLYKGNGRLRHETHFIEQGPFQAISFISYQSKEIDPTKKQGVYEVGGEYHLDIHVFRNSALFSDWKSYEKYSIKDLDGYELEGYSRGHQEDARRKCILEFALFLQGTSNECLSELPTHKRCVSLLSALYQSSVRAFNNKNPVVTIDY